MAGMCKKHAGFLHGLDCRMNVPLWNRCDMMKER